VETPDVAPDHTAHEMEEASTFPRITTRANSSGDDLKKAIQLIEKCACRILELERENKELSLRVVELERRHSVHELALAGMAERVDGSVRALGAMAGRMNDQEFILKKC